MLKSLRSFDGIITCIIFAAVVIGQLFRFNFVSHTRVTVTWLDIAIGASSLAIAARLLITGEFLPFLKTLWASPVWRWALLFLSWALLSLVLNVGHYSHSQVLTAFAYWVRIAGVLFVSGNYLVRTTIDRNLLRQIFLCGAAVAVLLGFIQLFLIPDFSFMARYGWDPHFGRLLSTFFDPNFFGVFIVLTMAISLASSWQRGGRNIYHLLFVLSWVALYVTYSRSAWLTGALVITALGLSKNWKLGLLFAAIFIGVVFLPNRLGARLQQANNTFRSEVTGSATSNQGTTAQFDPSAAARFNSLKYGWQVAKSNLVTGVGYNAYGAAAAKLGFSSEQTLETNLSAQGSDSSLLNILATTGVVGLVLFSGLLVSLVGRLYRLHKQSSNWFGIALSLMIIGWILGSFLNNTLLYLFLITPILILSANELREPFGE